LDPIRQSAKEDLHFPKRVHLKRIVTELKTGKQKPCDTQPRAGESARVPHNVSGTVETHIDRAIGGSHFGNDPELELKGYANVDASFASLMQKGSFTCENQYSWKGRKVDAVKTGRVEKARPVLVTQLNEFEHGVSCHAEPRNVPGRVHQHSD
jgi:hypothetical protein